MKPDIIHSHLFQAKFPLDKDWCDIDPTLNPNIPFKKGQRGDLEARTIFDVETKLPICAQEYRIVNGQKQHEADYEFYYNEEFPEDLFNFEVPDGVQVIDKR